MKRPTFAGFTGRFGDEGDASLASTLLRGPYFAAGLWRLDAKRNGGVLLLPLIAGLMAWSVYLSHDGFDVVLWTPTVQGIGYTLILAGPLVAALACWGASRSQRRGMNDLLGTVPLPRGLSLLAEWLGFVTWGLVAFLVSAAAALLWTATESVWGGPLLSPILVAAVAIMVCAAGGMLVGTLWPHRFVPPLLAAVVAVLIVAPAVLTQLSRFKMLSPLGPIDSVVREPLLQIDQRVFVPHLAWLGALAVTLLLALVAWRSRGWAARGLLFVSIVATLVTGSELYDYEQQNDYVAVRGVPIPYEPVCVTQTMTVCVHPAYKEILAEAATIIDAIAAPLAGVGVEPMRFEQRGWGFPPPEHGVVPLYIGDVDHLAMPLAYEVPRAMVMDEVAMSTRLGEDSWVTATQAIVAMWLTQDYQRRAGLDVEMPNPYLIMPGPYNSLVPIESVAEGDQFMTCSPVGEHGSCEYDYEASGPLQAQIDAATERFLELDPAARQAWLTANWADLRAGLLTLEDMP